MPWKQERRLYSFGFKTDKKTTVLKKVRGVYITSLNLAMTRKETVEKKGGGRETDEEGGQNKLGVETCYKSHELSSVSLRIM